MLSVCLGFQRRVVASGPQIAFSPSMQHLFQCVFLVMKLQLYHYFYFLLALQESAKAAEFEQQLQTPELIIMSEQ